MSKVESYTVKKYSQTLVWLCLIVSCSSELNDLVQIQQGQVAAWTEDRQMVAIILSDVPSLVPPTPVIELLPVCMLEATKTGAWEQG